MPLYRPLNAGQDLSTAVRPAFLDSADKVRLTESGGANPQFSADFSAHRISRAAVLPTGGGPGRGVGAGRCVRGRTAGRAGNFWHDATCVDGGARSGLEAPVSHSRQPLHFL